MKRFALLLILYSQALWLLPAQHLNLAWQPEFFNWPRKIEPFGEGWIVASELLRQNYHSHGPYLTRISAQGIEWGRRWAGGIPNALSAFAVLPGNRAAVSGLQGSCDTSGDVFFIIYNENGEEVYLKAENPWGENNIWVPLMDNIKSLPNGGYVVKSTVSVFTLDDTLGYRDWWGIDWPDESLRFLTSSNDSTFWVGFHKFERDYWEILPFTTRGYSLRRNNDYASFDLNTGANLLDLKAFEGTVYALSENAIWESRPPYQSPATHPLPLSGRDYFKLHRMANGFLLLGTDGQGRANILHLDTTFNFVDQWTYESDIFKPVDFAVRADTLAVLGQLTIPAAGRFLSGEYQRATGEANTLLAVKTFNVDGNAQAPQADVAITGMAWQGESAILLPNCSVDECGELYRITLEGFAINIRNKSPFPINSLALNTRRPQCYDCVFICENEQGYWQRYEDLQLLPGQEITLSFDLPMEFRRQQPGPDFELCFWVSDVDGHLEKDYANNLYCEALPVLPSFLPAKEWEAYPNPAADELQVSLFPAPVEESTLLVYNIAGQQVLSSLLPRYSLSYRLAVGDLPSGIYFLVWTDAKEQRVKKFVKR